MATSAELKVYSKTMLYKLLMIQKRAGKVKAEEALDDLIGEIKAGMDEGDVVHVEKEIMQRTKGSN